MRVAFDNALAHKIEAGSDMFLMPSRYEPCGLNQIYSLRYGTIPIVRATGGLRGQRSSQFDAAAVTGTGFKFTEYAPAALLACIDAALRDLPAPASLGGARWATPCVPTSRGSVPPHAYAQLYADADRALSGPDSRERWQRVPGT